MEHFIQGYKHFGDCYCVTNGFLELKIPLSFGIRIIYCGLKGKENMFYEQPAGAHFLSTEDGWRVYGGHRLWLAPESEETYFPDNQEVSCQIENDILIVEQPADKYLNIKKSMEIRFSEEDAHSVMITHKVNNMNEQKISAALWTISAMAEGAVLKVPFSGKPGGYNPNRSISLWGATELSDPRLKIERGSMTVGHSAIEEYFKLGLWCSDGRLSCTTNGQRISRVFDAVSGRIYPDNSVNVEIFQCREMMEVELLGPVEDIEPGETVCFTEKWKIE